MEEPINDELHDDAELEAGLDDEEDDPLGMKKPKSDELDEEDHEDLDALADTELGEEDSYDDVDEM